MRHMPRSTDRVADVELGGLIRTARQRLGLSQLELARRARVNRATILRLEKGCAVSGPVLVAVSGLLGINLSAPEPTEEP